jgi:serine/threonine protein phosphatase 1
MRTLAIGDIHGCRASLDHLLAFVDPKPGETIITLGDYVDRGPDSKGVIDRLIGLHVAGQLVPLRGNHELMMLGAQQGGQDSLHFWLTCGGVQTLESYVPAEQIPTPDDVPATHWHFLRHTCVDWYETDTHFFVHANVHPEKQLDEQTTEFLHWESFAAGWHRPHCSGKVMVCGHTQQRSGVPLNLGSAVCIDTWAYGGGWLTCLDVTTGDFWQANELGATRRGNINVTLRDGRTLVDDG